MTLVTQPNTVFHANRIENVTVRISINPTEDLVDQTIHFTTTAALPQSSASSANTLIPGLMFIVNGLVAARIVTKKNHKI